MKLRVDVAAFLGGVGLLVEVLLGIGDGEDGQVEVLGEKVVALVAAGHGHYGAGAVAGQHVVGQPNLHRLAAHRVAGRSCR